MLQIRLALLTRRNVTQSRRRHKSTLSLRCSAIPRCPLLSQESCWTMETERTSSHSARRRQSTVSQCCNPIPALLTSLTVRLQVRFVI